MTGRTFHANIHLKVPNELKERIDDAAATADLAISSFTSAIIDGALRSGSVERLLGLSELKGLKRRPYSHKWVSTGRLGYMRDEYVLHRRGTPGSPTRAKPGDGWYLEGPGIDQPMFMGLMVREARIEADVIVDRYAATGSI